MRDVKKATLGPCVIGEHLLLSITLAAIAERYNPDNPLRARMERRAREQIPLLLKQGNESGDLTGAIVRFKEHLELVLSQKEAHRALAEKATGTEANRKAVRAALEAGDVKRALEMKVFYLLKLEKYRDLQHPDIGRLMELAREAGDQKLFVRLGRALQEEPRRGPEDIEIEKLAFVLVEWWVKGPQGQLGLCRLTDEALTEFCILALNQRNLTMAAVRKARQRWGLKKGPKPWFTRVEKTGAGIVISLDE
jgi:hypothetical protein